MAKNLLFAMFGLSHLKAAYGMAHEYTVKPASCAIVILYILMVPTQKSIHNSIVCRLLVIVNPLFMLRTIIVEDSKKDRKICDMIPFL